MAGCGCRIEIADLQHGGVGRGRVTIQSGIQQLAEILHQFGSDRHDRAKIQQDDAVGRRVKPVIGKVGIGLHQAEPEQVLQDQIDQVPGDVIAQGLRAMRKGLDRLTVDIRHRQNLCCAQIGMQVGQAEHIRPRQQIAVRWRASAR